jgi:mobilome CxxCx(11)CxxC protein
MPISERSTILIVDETRKKAIHSFGYAEIFNKRASRLSLYLNLLKLFGILLPGSVGITYSQFGDKPAVQTWIIITWALSAILFLFSICAVAFKWDDELSYCFEASQNYNSLSARFKKLADFPPDSNFEFEKQYDLLNTEYRLRNEQDSKHDIKDYERRRGMKYALREFQIPCIGCDNVPISMESTDCSICGQYSFKHKYIPSWLQCKAS